jgi:phosphoenolpyruvate carboxykinase (ATP)
MVYLNLLRDYLKKYDVRTYLVNTGWTGGAYGVGKRISIHDTRSIITAILNGQLDDVACRYDKIFNLSVPTKVPGVEDKILDPSESWTDKDKYIDRAKKLAQQFVNNIKKFTDVEQSIINSGPKL